MGSSSITRSPLSPSPSLFFTKPVNFIQTRNPPRIHPSPAKNPQILRCIFNPSSRKPSPRRFKLSCLTISEPPILRTPTVLEKVQTLDFEFKSLLEPIDRVKRLLHYATLLPPFDESSRVQENRVLGCTAQVWMEVKMDGNGVMRFRVDSDSEITKGFCSCLIWVLDGAGADEVLSVKIEDLVEMNVGLPSRGNSRVNTWHNVLISMQKRTKDLVDEKMHHHQCLQGVCSLAAVNGRCKEAQVRNTLNLEMSFRTQDSGVADPQCVNDITETIANYISNAAVCTSQRLGFVVHYLIEKPSIAYVSMESIREIYTDEAVS